MDNKRQQSTAERVGQNIRGIRLSRGQTLAGLSGRLGEIGHPIGVATLSKIELGHRRIAVDDLEALAAALGAGADDLLAHPEKNVAAIEDLLTRFEHAIAQHRQQEEWTRAAQSELDERLWAMGSIAQQLRFEVGPSPAVLPDKVAQRLTKLLREWHERSNSSPGNITESSQP